MWGRALALRGRVLHDAGLKPCPTCCGFDECRAEALPHMKAVSVADVWLPVIPVGQGFSPASKRPCDPCGAGLQPCKQLTRRGHDNHRSGITTRRAEAAVAGGGTVE